MRQTLPIAPSGFLLLASKPLHIPAALQITRTVLPAACCLPACAKVCTALSAPTLCRLHQPLCPIPMTIFRGGGELGLPFRAQAGSLLLTAEPAISVAPPKICVICRGRFLDACSLVAETAGLSSVTLDGSCLLFWESFPHLPITTANPESGLPPAGSGFLFQENRHPVLG